MNAINTYKSSAKGIAIFGGLQVFKILLSVIRTKCSALFLGPAGFGIYSLISSTLTSIELATNCGLGTSAVKDIAKAEGSPLHTSQAYTVLNRLVWITGVLAVLLCGVSSKWLSISAFGNTDYTWAFALGAISLLCSQLMAGQGALLTGLRKYRYITRLNIWSNIASVIITVTLYWKWNVDAIVPVILLSSIINLVFSAYYARKINLPATIVSIKSTLTKGWEMLKTGIFISLSSALTVLAGYAIRIFISQTTDVVQVGLFTAVFSLVNTYLGMVFSSIERDFFPRLCAVADSVDDTSVAIRQENELLILLLAPLVAIFIAFAPMVLTLFYSDKFIEAESMMGFTAFALFLKIPSWTMSIVFLAKGDNRTYFVTQLAFTAYCLAFNTAGFYFGGLTGLGISFIPAYLLYIVHAYLLCTKKYEFRFGWIVWRKLSGYAASLICVCVAANWANPLVRHILETLLVVSITAIALKELNEKLALTDYIRKKIKR